MMAYKNVENFLENKTETENDVMDEEDALENYNFECECDEFRDEFYDKEGRAKTSAIERYLSYRATYLGLKVDGDKYANAKKFVDVIREKSYCLNLPDSDGSGKHINNALVHDVYNKLWGWTQSEKTFGRLQEFKKKKGFEFIFGADTMHSVQTVFNAVVGKIEKKKDREVYIQYCMERFYDSKIHHKEKCDAKECLYKNCFACDINKETPALKNYIDAYHTIGNFVLVPAGFNGRRGCNIAIGDYWDLSLKYLKGEDWEKTGNPNGRMYPEWDEESDGYTKENYNQYINYFFLWDYVDSEGEPLSLFQENNFFDNPKTLGKDEDNKLRKEKDISEYQVFLGNATACIKRRGIFMVAMLQLQHLLDESDENLYDELREEVFVKGKVSNNREGESNHEQPGIYGSFGEVFDALEKCLDDMKNKEKIDAKCHKHITHDIFAKAREKINAIA